MLELLKKSWRGEASLNAAFWVVFAFVNLLIITSLTVIFHSYLQDYDYTKRIVNTILFPYMVFSAICVWRCEKDASEFFIAMTKSIVILSVIGFFPLSLNNQNF